MQRILVAVDGSAHALKGVAQAAELAKALQARLEVVYVLPPILLAPSVYGEAIKKLEEGNRIASESILRAAHQVAEQAQVPMASISLTGAPAEAIADLALAPDVWGVVIGAQGHSAVSRVLLGSVTDRLVHICSKPVLVVR